MPKLDLKFTLVILIIVIIAFLVITAWDEFLDRSFFYLTGLDPNRAWSWLILAIISTAILILILIITGIEAHDVLGVSETVDEILTNEYETR